MKKYFVAETNEEIQMGEILQLDFAKKVKNGTIKHTEEITLKESSLPWLLKTGIIEEREVEEEESNTSEEDFLDFGDVAPCETLMNLEEDFIALEEKVNKLENLTIGALKKTLNIIDELLKKELPKDKKEEKKTTQPKKK